MKYDQKVFINQLPLVDVFAKHLTMHRELQAVNPGNISKNIFLGHTSDAHLVLAAIYWCMVFGAVGTNETHWKYLSKENIQNFRDELSDNLNIPYKEYESYWKDLTEFRNNYAAHRAINFRKPVPSFDLALDVAIFYDKWVRRIIHPDKLNKKPLLTLIEEFKMIIKGELKLIISPEAEQ